MLVCLLDNPQITKSRSNCFDCCCIVLSKQFRWSVKIHCVKIHRNKSPHPCRVTVRHLLGIRSDILLRGVTEESLAHPSMWTTESSIDILPVYPCISGPWTVLHRSDYR